MQRDYATIARTLTGLSGSRDERMRTVVDALWEHLANTGVSWVGFYVIADDQSEMTLSHRRNTPACSPIGLHGACGQCWQSRQPIVVDDVRELGEGYIACDPRDLSEVVVPLLDADGSCWGVLDLDSHQVGAFTGQDASELTLLMRTTGLSS
jgi:putative methionine-R-sulfoxide reductase with GAF domain